MTRAHHHIPSLSLPRFRAVRFAATCGAAALFLSACGRVGAIHPPEYTAPAPVKELQAQGQVDGVKLTWQAPTEDGSGGDLKSLDHFLVQRSDYVKGETPDFSTIAEVVPPDIQAKKDEIKAQEAKGEAESDSAEAAKASKKTGTGSFGFNTSQKAKLKAPLTYLDNTVVLGRRYDYRVIGVNESGTKGRTDLLLRVSFAGEATRVESVAVTQTKK